MSSATEWIASLWADKSTVKEKQKTNDEVGRNTIITDDDGSVVISAPVRNTNLYHYEWDLDNQADQVQLYRKIALHADVDYAIEDICNESINYDDHDTLPVNINLEEVDISPAIKQKISDEYIFVMKLLDFRNKGFDHFKEWYIEGRAFYHMIPNKMAKRGLMGIRKFDSAKTKRVKEIIQDPVTMKIEHEEIYYIYDETLGQKTSQSAKMRQTSKRVIKFPQESVAYLDSGIFDPYTGFARSHLHKAVKPANQLQSIEDATVVYRLVRAPERRVFYVDVGNLPKTKADQYVKSLADNYRKKMIYDGVSGEVAQKTNHLAMQEDIWLPRKSGKGTEVSTLSGGQNLGEIADIEYFLKKLYKSLNMPLSRLDTSSVFNIGRTTEITRDELKFNKFIVRLRKKYTNLFLQILRTQVVLKGIVSEQEWDDFSPLIKFTFTQDMAISEQKANDILQDRLEIIDKLGTVVGKYISNEYVMREIMKMTEDEMTTEKSRIDKEKSDPRFKKEEEDEGFGK